jgi:D-aminopeptidase
MRFDKTMSQEQLHPSSGPRVRDLGITIGTLPAGRHNAITDVAGVTVGHATVWFGEGPLRPGKGPARTGVTVIRPHGGNLFLEKVPAAIEVINGFGKTTGLAQVDELGTIETPIALTSTLCVGRVVDALISDAIANTPEIGVGTSTVNPVVGECSDAYLNDMQGRHVHEAHVMEALVAANGGSVTEGAIGAGTGMSAFGFKGGIGTASRRVPEAVGGWTVGVLVLANFGSKRQLVIDGVPVGRMLDAEATPEPERGSIMMVVATDAPFLDRSLRRLARRTAFGLARTGSMGGHGSGDIAIAFSAHPGVRIPHYATASTSTLALLHENGPKAGVSPIDALFQATIESTEEAILNALFRAVTVVGRDGNTREALPIERVLEILNAYRQI